MVDAAGSREMTLKDAAGIGRVNELSDRDVQPHGKSPGGGGGRLFLVAEFEGTVAVNVGLRLDDVN